MFQSFLSTANAFTRYGNPFSLALQRATHRPVHTIADRATGVRLRCRAGAARMMPETYHSHDYDLTAVPLRPGDLVLDIGANHGFYSVYAAYHGATVHAFEPSPSLQPFLNENIRANGLASRVTVHACAVGAEDGEITLYESGALGGGVNSTQPAFAHALSAEFQQPFSETRVPCQSFATVFAEAVGTADPAARVRLVKIDCEGAEIEILPSLTPDILSRIDGFAVEYHPEAYSLEKLVDLALSLPGFHLSRLPQGAVTNDMFHLTSVRALKEAFALPGHPFGA